MFHFDNLKKEVNDRSLYTDISEYNENMASFDIEEVMTDDMKELSRLTKNPTYMSVFTNRSLSELI